MTENRGCILPLGQDMKKVFSTTCGSPVWLIPIWMELLTRKMFDSEPRYFHTSFMRDNYGNKITVWVAISSHGIIGPVFFNETVNSYCYLAILHNNFMLQLIATELPISTQ
jgi:hypothetical protein